jgi:hypothetical protein
LCTVLRQRRRRRLLDDRDDQRSAVISSVISHQSSVICHLYIPVHHSAACTASCPAPSAKKNRMFGDTVRFAAAATRAGSSKPVSTSARTSSSSPITATPTSLKPGRAAATADSRYGLQSYAHTGALLPATPRSALTAVHILLGPGTASMFSAPL